MTAIATTIAGSDSGGGAGIQADLKTFSALGVYSASVITALTAQNTRGVTAIHDVPPEFITQQMDAVFSDLKVGAVKIGMLSQSNIIETVAEGLKRYNQETIILDPVMVATSGDMLISQDAVKTLKKQPHPNGNAHHTKPARGSSPHRTTTRNQQRRHGLPSPSLAGQWRKSSPAKRRPQRHRQSRRPPRNKRSGFMAQLHPH